MRVAKFSLWFLLISMIFANFVYGEQLLRTLPPDRVKDGMPNPPEWVYKKPSGPACGIFIGVGNAESEGDARANARKFAADFFRDCLGEFNIKIEKEVRNWSGKSTSIYNPEIVSKEIIERLADVATKLMEDHEWYLEEWQKDERAYWKAYGYFIVGRSKLNEQFSKSIDQEIGELQKKQDLSETNTAKDQILNTIKSLESLKGKRNSIFGEIDDFKVKDKK
jgi:hypothetical protein